MKKIHTKYNVGDLICFKAIDSFAPIFHNKLAIVTRVEHEQARYWTLMLERSFEEYNTRFQYAEDGWELLN